MRKEDNSMEEMYSLNEVRSRILESHDLGGAIRLLDETISNHNTATSGWRTSGSTTTA